MAPHQSVLPQPSQPTVNQLALFATRRKEIEQNAALSPEQRRAALQALSVSFALAAFFCCSGVIGVLVGGGGLAGRKKYKARRNWRPKRRGSGRNMIPCAVGKRRGRAYFCETCWPGFYLAFLLPVSLNVCCNVSKRKRGTQPNAKPYLFKIIHKQ